MISRRRDPVSVVVVVGMVVGACSGTASVERTASDDECRRRPGRVERVVLDAEGRPIVEDDVGAGALTVEANVYRPACHEDDASTATPTLYLLHGAGMSSATWERPPMSMTERLDELFSSGALDPMIVVLPEDSTDAFEFAERNLAPLDEHLRASSPSIARGSRAIGGFSAGGPTAALAAFTADREHVAVGLFSSIWPESFGRLIAEAEPRRSADAQVLIDIGETDGLVMFQADQVDALRAVGIEPDVRSSPGGHDFPFVAQELDEWLDWFDTVFDERPTIDS